jgi:hypothetical protein
MAARQRTPIGNGATNGNPSILQSPKVGRFRELLRPSDHGGPIVLAHKRGCGERTSKFSHDGGFRGRGVSAKAHQEGSKSV